MLPSALCGRQSPNRHFLQNLQRPPLGGWDRQGRVFSDRLTRPRSPVSMGATWLRGGQSTSTAFSSGDLCMSQRIVRPRAQHLAVALCAFALLLVNHALGQQPLAKRPLRHSDYDSWRSIQSPQFSPDGKFLAYALTPQEGDGEVVVRNLTTAAEWRYPRGGRLLVPPLLPRSSLARPAPAASLAVRLAFNADWR